MTHYIYLYCSPIVGYNNAEKCTAIELEYSDALNTFDNGEGTNDGQYWSFTNGVYNT